MTENVNDSDRILAQKIIQTLYGCYISEVGDECRECASFKECEDDISDVASMISDAVRSRANPAS